MWWRAIVCLIVAAAFGLNAATAHAQSGQVDVPATTSPLPGSQFQGGDGNQDDDTAAGLIDWQGVEADGRVAHTSDPQANDNIFSSGSKELEPGHWDIHTHDGGATPHSGNVLDFYRAFEHLQDGDPFLYLAFTRYSSHGTIYVTFELDQDDACRIPNEPCGTWRNGEGAVVPCRTTGDLLISFTTAGHTATVKVARWNTVTRDADTHCATSGTLTPATNVTPPPSATANVQAASNYTVDSPTGPSIPTPIRNYLPGFFACPNGPGTCDIPTEQFGEAAINLSSVLGAVGGGCEAFGSTWMHSRSSLSDTADMKDYVAPQPFRASTCKTQPTLTSSASGLVHRHAHGPHRLRRHRPLSDTLTIHDTATLSGGDEPTGTITWHLYGPGDDDCSTPIFTYRATVDGNGSYRSGSFAPTEIGTYRWRVEYSGDDFNDPAGPTACGKDTETITIDKGNPSLTSEASGPTHLEPVAVGPRRRHRVRSLRVHTARATQPISDAAHLDGGFNPTGTITFRLYGPRDPTCDGPPIAVSHATVEGNGTYYSEPFIPTRAGTYRWVVEYSGDHNNEPAGPTACGDPDETIVVGRARPTIATVASPGTEVDHPITDTALLSGGARPRGRIIFRLYGPDDEDCSGDPVHTSRRRVRGNGEYASSEFTPTRPGTYRWVAIYSGDRNNARAVTSCGDAGENVVVGRRPPAQPDLSTTAFPAEARAGMRIRDIAHLTGGDNPGGSISFALFGPDDPTCANDPVFLTSRTVDGDGDYTSRAFTVRRVGTYHWVAVYSGDDDNLSAGPTACDDPAETVTVAQAQPRIRTVAQPSALVGHGFHDVAFLSGASRPRGRITFRLYGPDDPTCSGAPVFTARQHVVGRNGLYLSPRFRGLQAGTYLWTASYSGDRNNLGAATACGDRHESTVVLPRRPRLRTSASPPAYLHHRRARRVRAAGQEIYDSARLTRTFRGRGVITFDLYGPDDSTCSGPPIFRSVIRVRGDGIYNSARFTPTASGVHRWRATYSGDANNRSAGPTRCGDRREHVRVTLPAHPKLTTSASQAVTLGGAIHDVAHLSGGHDPTGTITFRLYRSRSCSGRPVFTSTVAVNGNDDYTSASFVPTRAGAYRWVAKYSGDARNHPAGPTACGDRAERAIVRPPTITPVVPSFSTSAAARPAGGATLHDTAFLSGGIDPTGAITFELFGPDDATCSGPPVFVTREPVTGNGAYRSTSFAVPGPGIYRWVVTYSGDALNAGVGPTTCGDPTETTSVDEDPAGESSVGPDVPAPPPEPKPEGGVKGQGRPKPPSPPPPIVTG